jgi:Zn-dependent protease
VNGSWHLGKLFGIDIRLHWTFLLLPAYIYVSSLAAGSSFVSAIVAVLFVLSIFGCVLLHELGHALTARRFGIPTRDITLLPIGGVASLERVPRQPWQELAIAVAGPAVNVVIAAIAFTGWSLLGLIGSSTLASLAAQFAMVNVALVVFNMLPAFPMDGGRVLRSLLAMRMPYAEATRIAARVGQVTAVAFGVLGLISGNLMLAVIAAFIFFAAHGEASRVGEVFGQPDLSSEQVKQRLLDRSFGNMPDIRALPIVSAQWNAQNALGWLGNDALEEFLVSRGGAVVGVLGKSDLRKAVVEGRGAMAIERLLAYGWVQLRSLRPA